MTDKNEMIEHIEDLLGSEGSRAIAEAMFQILEEHGHITFEPHAGFELAQVDNDEWLSMLIETDDADANYKPGRWSADTGSRYR